ncbi:hypothetical protein NDA01_24720 [Trichocoleus desertorum AS-A10]|uniref:hypothetical protein n=1 Tax=Trichocoleus desertorum TaxID=1481672 RepID=UPI0032972B89
MSFKIESKPSTIVSLLPQEIPLPQFPLFGRLEIDGATMQIIGLNHYCKEAAEQLELQPGWSYQVSNGGPFVSVLSEQELLDYSPSNQVEVVAIAA